MQSTRQFCLIVKKLQFSRQIFEKYSDVKLIENPFSGSRVVRTYRQTGVTQLIVAFRNFVSAAQSAATP